MTQKKLLLIVNPCSGRAKMKNELLRVVEVLSEADYEVTVYPTKDRGDATIRVEKLKEKEFDRIVVCGGDGTLNEVITGIMRADLKTEIGYIPAGTLNEWSTSLGISKTIVTAAKDVVSGSAITLDIGKFNEKNFTYTASFGAFTEASYSTPQDVKNVLGQAAYIIEGIKSVGNIKPIHMKFTADDRVIEGDFLFGAVSNSMSVGGIVKFSNGEVELNDGFFEVFLIRNPDNILKIQPLIDGILRKELNREGMEFFRTKNVTVETEEKVSWTLDGEYAEGKEKIEISNIHNAINLIVPKK